MKIFLFSGVGNVDLGKACSDVTDCEDRHTECSVAGQESPICRCIDGYYDSNTEDNLGGICNESKWLILEGPMED